MAARAAIFDVIMDWVIVAGGQLKRSKVLTSNCARWIDETIAYLQLVKCLVFTHFVRFRVEFFIDLSHFITPDPS